MKHESQTKTTYGNYGKLSKGSAKLSVSDLKEKVIFVEIFLTYNIPGCQYNLLCNNSSC